MTDPLARARTATYTPDGQVVSVVTARGNASATPAAGTVSYRYDELGRQLSRGARRRGTDGGLEP